MLNIIVAMDRNNVIGKDNKLPWHLPNDLKYFRETTEGSIVIMGRKTFESIGKPLPNRVNVILTKNKKYKLNTENMSGYNPCVIEPIETILLANTINPEQEFFIIGGSEIFKEFEDSVNYIYITRIDAEFDGDTYFNPNLSSFSLIKQIPGVVDSKNKYPHFFQIYKRND